jgi:IS5 family transposase
MVVSEGTMRPQKPKTTGEDDLFRARLEQIINMKHELVQLAGKIDWDWIDREIAPLYSDKGRPGIETRFVIGLILLKHIYGLSDEAVCERWIYDPYFQHFTGEEFFQHEFPHERSDLSHWRKRLGSKLELLLAESLRVAHEVGALRTRDLKRVTVDTTVQPKAITFPTDAKLLHAAIKGLNRLARKGGVRLRQSYLRIAKRAAMMASRYAHAKQFKRHHRQLRLLRSRLGRIIRDIRRKITGRPELEAVFEAPIARARRSDRNGSASVDGSSIPSTPPRSNASSMKGCGSSGCRRAEVRSGSRAAVAGRRMAQPVCPDQRISSDCPGMSGWCQNQPSINRRSPA